MTFYDSLRELMLAGLGAQEKIKDFMDDLVKKGEISESESGKLFKEWIEKANKNAAEIPLNFSKFITGTMEKMNLPTRDDIEKLNLKINSLSERLSKLEESKEK